VHCIPLAILSRLSQFPSPAVGIHIAWSLTFLSVWLLHSCYHYTPLSVVITFVWSLHACECGYYIRVIITLLWVWLLHSCDHYTPVSVIITFLSVWLLHSYNHCILVSVITTFVWSLHSCECVYYIRVIITLLWVWSLNYCKYDHYIPVSMTITFMWSFHHIIINIIVVKALTRASLFHVCFLSKDATVLTIYVHPGVCICDMVAISFRQDNKSRICLKTEFCFNLFLLTCNLLN